MVRIVVPGVFWPGRHTFSPVHYTATATMWWC